jgi:hypothetical protein
MLNSPAKIRTYAALREIELEDGIDGEEIRKILGISSRNGKQQVILLILLMTCCDATKMTMKKKMFDLQPTYISPKSGEFNSNNDRT